MNAYDYAVSALALATVHKHQAQMASSAEFCLDDAKSLFGRQNYRGSIRASMKCLAYSVGIFHPSFQMVKEWLAEVRQ